ncbi:MAG: hypothetical protein AB8B84_01505 [Granulosicoccus sp.]
MPWCKTQLPIIALTENSYREMNTISPWASNTSEGYQSSE